MLNVKKTKEMVIHFRITKNPCASLKLMMSPLKPLALTSIWVSELTIN